MDAKSLSARRAWIEISKNAAIGNPTLVALRKESVDRNDLLNFLQCLICVALRKESVDRNRAVNSSLVIKLPSLSARRAWIEMGTCRSSNSVGYRRSPQGERG